LTYEAGAGCPNEQQFVGEVNARVRLPIRWSASDSTLQMSVKLAQRSETAEFAGALQIDRQGDSSQREFSARSCDEVASALALVAALTLDPNARTEAIAKSDVAAGVTTSKPVAVATNSSALSESETERRPAKPSSPSPPAHERGAFWSVGATSQVVSGYAPEPLVLLGVGAGFRAGRPPFSPGLRLTALWGRTGTTGPADGSARFEWALGRLEGCPVSFRVATRTRLEPCAGFELGRLSARGADAQVAFPVTAKRWWLAAGASLALRQSFGALFVRAAASMLFPIERDEFVFKNPDEQVHRPSAVGFGGDLSFGFEFGR
jgi:hypothetical protein